MQFNYARKEGVFYMNQIPVEANKTPVYFVVPGVMNLCKFPPSPIHSQGALFFTFRSNENANWLLY